MGALSTSFPPFADLGKQEIEDILACLAYTIVYFQAIQGLDLRLQPENGQYGSMGFSIVLLTTMSIHLQAFSQTAWNSCPSQDNFSRPERTQFSDVQSLILKDSGIQKDKPVFSMETVEPRPE